MPWSCTEGERDSRINGESMKTLVTIICLLLTIILSETIALVTPPAFKPIGSLSMDGLGYYLIDNFMIDSDRCIHFLDATKTPIKFCGSYKLKLNEMPEALQPNVSITRGRLSFPV